MSLQPTAHIISDFPIFIATANAVLRHRYTIHIKSWAEYAEQPVQRSDLLVVDVTRISAQRALAYIACDLSEARIVLCSLHRNEVDVYRVGRNGFMVEGAFPSLLALAG